MFKRINKYLKTFSLSYACSFLFILILAKVSGFNPRDPIVLTWDEVFSGYLKIAMIISLIVSLIAVYGRWDDNR